MYWSVLCLGTMLVYETMNKCSINTLDNDYFNAIPTLLSTLSDGGKQSRGICKENLVVFSSIPVTDTRRFYKPSKAVPKANFSYLVLHTNIEVCATY